jgi:hypothetical protein
MLQCPIDDGKGIDRTPRTRYRMARPPERKLHGGAAGAIAGGGELSLDALLAR